MCLIAVLVIRRFRIPRFVSTLFNFNSIFEREHEDGIDVSARGHRKTDSGTH